MALLEITSHHRGKETRDQNLYVLVLEPVAMQIRHQHVNYLSFNPRVCGCSHLDLQKEITVSKMLLKLRPF